MIKFLKYVKNIFTRDTVESIDWEPVTIRYPITNHGGGGGDNNNGKSTIVFRRLDSSEKSKRVSSGIFTNVTITPPVTGSRVFDKSIRSNTKVFGSSVIRKNPKLFGP